MPTTDYVNPQANFIEDDDVKKFIKGDTSTPKFDFQSAQPLKTIPQLFTNRSARYVRPETEEERGQATADYLTGTKPSPIEKERRIAQSPEVTTGLSALAGFGTEAFGNWLPYPAAAVRGITSTTGLGEKKQKQQDTGDPYKDLMNNLWDNAMRGIFEPETVNPTSIHIQEHPEIFGKTNHATAAVWGTLAEFTATMSLNPLALIPEGFQALSKESQNTLLFNKLTQSSQWGDNINAIAGKTGVSWQKILPQAQRELWDAITKGNYFQVVLKNIELYQPLKLAGLTTEDVEGGEAAQEEYTTVYHRTDADVDEIKKKGFISLENDKVFVGNKSKGQISGYGVNIIPLIVKKSDLEIQDEFPSGEEHYAIDVKKANQYLQKPEQDKAVQSETVAPYEVQQPTAPKNLIAMRQNYLEEKSDSIDAQMRDLEAQQKRLRDNGLSTGRIDAKLMKLGQDWTGVENQIAENIIGQVKINKLKEEIGQTKIENIINDVQEARDKGVSAGMRKGLTIGKEKGRLEEVQRKAALQLFAKYKQNAIDEMNKIASTLQRIKDSTEGLPLEYKQELDKILKNFDLKNRTSKTLAEREGRKEFIERAKANGDDINIPDDVIEMAYSTPLNELTVNQLRDINNMVGNIYRMGKLKNKLIEAKGLRDLEAVVKESVGLITGGKGLAVDSNLVKLMKERDKDIVKLISQGKWLTVKEFIESNLLPELECNFLDGVDHTGIATRTLFDPMHEASNKFVENQDKAYKAIGDMFNHRDPKQWQELIKVGKLNLKRSEMMHIFASAANDSSREYLYGFGLTDEDIAAVEKALPEEDKMAVRKLWNYFDKEQFPRLFKERYSIEGISTKQEPNYFPITNTENVPSNDDLEWERMYRESLRMTRGSVDKGMLEKRTGVQGAFRKLDFFGTIGRGIDRAEHYLAYARVIRNANKFLNHPDIKAAITNNKNFGEHYYNTLTKWVKDAARGKLDYDTGWPARLSRGGRLNLAPAVLGLNFLTAEKQFVGLLSGMEMAGKSATLKILPKLILNYTKLSKEIGAESAMMNFRGMRQEREFEEMRSERSFFEKGGKLTFKHDFQQKMMFLVQQSDLLISRACYLGTKEALKAQGVTDKDQLIREAERVVRRTQPTGGLIYLPDIFRGGELEKQFTFLKGHRNKFFNIQLEMLAKKANGSMSNARFTAGVLFNTILPILTLGYIERKQLNTAADWVAATGSQAFSGVAVVQDLFDSYREGKWTFSEPFIEYMEMAGKIFSSKKMGTKIKRALEFAGTSMGLPVVGIERFLKGQPFGAERKKKYDKDFNQGTSSVDLMK